MPKVPPIRKRIGARSLLCGDIAFVGLLALAAFVGGGSVLAGLPQMAQALLPGGITAAQASDAELGESAALFLRPSPAGPNSYAPQLLYPVTGRAFPDWLTSPRREAAALPIRRVPAIAICIDDLGEDIAATDRAIALPREVALSFLPFADAAAFLAPEAEHGGHEVLVHMPMEALGNHNPGMNALMVGLPAAEIRRRLDWAFARVPGFSGINNHEGSRFTADAAALVPVVEALAPRHVYFFDSRTAPDSQVVRVAHAFGVASAERDIFLDDENTAAAVAAQLTALEARARAQGVAIAIGHPHDATLAALARWTAVHKGFELVPLSQAIRLKTERAVAALH